MSLLSRYNYNLDEQQLMRYNLSVTKGSLFVKTIFTITESSRGFKILDSRIRRLKR